MPRKIPDDSTKIPVTEESDQEWARFVERAVHAGGRPTLYEPR